MSFERIPVKSILAIIAAVLTIATALPGRAQSPSSSPKAAHPAAKPVADPALIDLAGYNDIIAKYRGKPLVVNFWATWCEPCRAEYPMIVELAKEYGPKGVSVIGVSLDDDSDMNLVRRFIARNQPGFPNYRQKPGIDMNSFYQGVSSAWHGTMPATFFYTRDGKLAGNFEGTRPREVFEGVFRALLSGSGAGTGK